MTEALDEAAAWRRLMEIDPGSSGAAGPVRVSTDGSWTCATGTTRDAATLLDVFTPLRVRERLAVGQLGQSLDGRIATESGESHFINGPDDIRRLHRLRALVQAVVVGAGTVASDDPRLTVRRVEGENPVRVVLDPRGRLEPTRVVFTDEAAPTLWVRARAETSASTGQTAPSSRPPGAGDHVEVVTLPCVDGRTEGAGGFAPQAVLAMLESRGLRRVLVEGGGVTVSRFLAAGALDRLHVSVAPLLIGSGRPSFTLPPIERLDQAIRPRVRHFRLGSDLLFDLSLDRNGAP